MPVPGWYSTHYVGYIAMKQTNRRVCRELGYGHFLRHFYHMRAEDIWGAMFGYGWFCLEWKLKARQPMKEPIKMPALCLAQSSIWLPDADQTVSADPGCGGDIAICDEVSWLDHVLPILPWHFAYWGPWQVPGYAFKPAIIILFGREKKGIGQPPAGGFEPYNVSRASDDLFELLP